MTREIVDNFEDHLQSIRTEWSVVKEKWFHGEIMDPVFEGVVRDFCSFDEMMHNVHNKVQVFMRGVEGLANGMTVLSDGVSGGLSHAAANDSLIASDGCKLKEATNQIARADAPHSAIAKLRRDMHFNILNPVQNHIANNRNLKVSLDIRRRRLIELNSAKKHFDEVVKKNIATTDRRYLQAQSAFESAKITFNDVDRHVFEWLYILEEYRGDILDSTLQTLKYLEYEFFASSAHAISTSLPSRMEFRPMVEMTPEHLEAQVEMELQKSEETEIAASTGITDTSIIDFSARLIDKKVKEDPADQDGPSLPVDPLSLSSLLSQGFEEGPARRALRKHQNDTQAALDWLINGQAEEEEKRKLVSDGVRMPTTVKRVQKLKAMRRAQQEKLKEKERAAEAHSDTEDKDKDSEDRDSKGLSNGSGSASPEARSKPAPSQESKPAPAPADLLDGLDDQPSSSAAAAAKSPAAVGDLLGFDERPAEPTDFSKPLDLTSLPAQLSFDTSKCEKPPLEAAVAAGIAQPRGPAPALPAAEAPAGAAAALAGLSPEVLAQIQAIASSSQGQLSREQLLSALAASTPAVAAPAPAPVAAAGSPAASGSSPASSGWDRLTGGDLSLGGGLAGMGAGGAGGGVASSFKVLDPFADAAAAGGAPASAPAPAAAAPSGDHFGDLVNLTSPTPTQGGYPGSS